jgi:hypothetical protein
MKEQSKNPHAVALGRKGGMVKSQAKKAAAQRNIMARWQKNNQLKPQ